MTGSCPMDTAPGSPHRAFAENLRALCAQHGSIAAVCRGLGMNRQQFNKYLSGAVLPAPRSLARIAAFFGRPADTLFHAAPGGALQGCGQPDDGLSTLGLTLGGRDTPGPAPGALRPGCYHLFTPWPRDPAHCLRAALFVRPANEVARFSLLTRFRAPLSRQRHCIGTRVDGIVLGQGRGLFLLGVGARAGGLHLVAFGPEAAAGCNLMCGVALGTDLGGLPLAQRATLDYRGSAAEIRQVIGEAAIIPLADPGIPDEVRASMTDPIVLEPFSLLDGLARAAP